MNLYRYCQNNPWNVVDPFGRDPCSSDPCDPCGLTVWLDPCDPCSCSYALDECPSCNRQERGEGFTLASYKIKPISGWTYIGSWCIIADCWGIAWSWAFGECGYYCWDLYSQTPERPDPAKLRRVFSIRFFNMQCYGWKMCPPRVNVKPGALPPNGGNRPVA